MKNYEIIFFKIYSYLKWNLWNWFNWNMVTVFNSTKFPSNLHLAPYKSVLIYYTYISAYSIYIYIYYTYNRSIYYATPCVLSTFTVFLFFEENIFFYWICWFRNCLTKCLIISSLFLQRTERFPNLEKTIEHYEEKKKLTFNVFISYAFVEWIILFFLCYIKCRFFCFVFLKWYVWFYSRMFFNHFLTCLIS